MAEERNSRWSTMIQRFAPTACILSVAAVLIVAAVTTQSEKPGVQATPVETGVETPLQKLVADGNRSFQQKNWNLSIAIYEKIVKQNPDECMAWFRLGYCLHVSKQYDGAINAYKQALAMPCMIPVTNYNMACAYALKGMKSEMLAYLKKSIEAGFRSPRPISEDPDFHAYLDDPEFQKLAGVVVSATGEAAYRQFDFWIGKWDVYDAKGQKVGINEITKSENGFLLTEKWKNLKRPGSGTSINYYDPPSRQWKQVWVDAEGGNIRYSGVFKAGKMQFTGNYYDRNGERGISKATYTPLKDGRVHQLIQHSTDAGKTWKVYFSGFYTRQYSTL